MSGTITTRSLVSLASLAIVVALSMPARIVAATPSGRVAIMNAHSGLCLSPAGGGRDNNGQIVQFTCDQDPSRFWSFTVVNGDMVEITNVNSGLCLTIAGGSTERNMVSVQYTCDSDPSRRWRYIVVDPTTFRLVNVHSGLCLTVAGGGTDRNTTAVQYPCDGDPSRNWKISFGR
jgi:cytolethal distending toxin subunit A